MGDVTIGLAFIAGLLSFISPCVLPLVPAYIGYMGGRMTRTISMQMTGGKAKVDTPSTSVFQRAQMMAHGVAFVAGFTVVFVLIGLMTTAFVSVVGSSVTTLTDMIGRIGGLVIIVFGLHFMGALQKFFQFLRRNPHWINQPFTSLFMLIFGILVILWGATVINFGGTSLLSGTDNLIFAAPFLAVYVLWFVFDGAFIDPAGFWDRFLGRIEVMLYSDTRGEMKRSKNQGLSGSFFMGVVFSAGWTPCIGPLLGTILTVAAQTGDVSIAIPLLTAYSLGLGIPFIITALLMDGAQGLLRRLQRHMGKIEFFSGGLLVLIGILIASGQLTILSQNLSNQFADFSFRVEECGVGFFEGDLEFSHVGDCVAGTLHPIALNQNMYANLSSDSTSTDFLIRLDEEMVVDVELSKIDESLDLTVGLLGDDGLVEQSDTLTAIDEDTFVAIAGLPLTAGLHRFTVTDDNAGEEARFRLKIRASQPIANTNEAPDVVELDNDIIDEDGALAELGQEGINTIEGLASQTDAVEGLNIGNLAPDFTVTTIGDETITLSELRGQPVIVNFWGTWCGPCRREMPDLQNKFEAYEEDGLIILGLAVRDTVEDVRDFQKEFGLTFTLALDEGEVITEQYAIPGQPSTFILDRNGVIVFRSFSLITEEQLSEALALAYAE